MRTECRYKLVQAFKSRRRKTHQTAAACTEVSKLCLNGGIPGINLSHLVYTDFVRKRPRLSVFRKRLRPFLHGYANFAYTGSFLRLNCRTSCIRPLSMKSQD
jgi:hypothetical protein